MGLDISNLDHVEVDYIIKITVKHVVVGIIERKNSANEPESLLISAKKDFGNFTGFYYPPGGHLEQNEDEKAALIREIKEEIGLTVEPMEKLAETDSDIENQTTHWWRCRIISGELKINTSEIAAAKFFSKNEMSKLNLWPATKAFFEKYII